jgi:hypothetical protein
MFYYTKATMLKKNKLIFIAIRIEIIHGSQNVLRVLTWVGGY